MAHGFKHRMRVFLSHKEAAFAVLDGLNDASVRSGHNGQSARHGFQHGVGHSLLVSVRAEFAGMEEKMGLFEEAPELGLRNEACE